MRLPSVMVTPASVEVADVERRVVERPPAKVEVALEVEVMDATVIVEDATRLPLPSEVITIFLPIPDTMRFPEIIALPPTDNLCDGDVVPRPHKPEDEITLVSAVVES